MIRLALIGMALACISADTSPQPIQLGSIGERATELDSRLVEFDAYAWQPKGDVLMVTNGAVPTHGEGRGIAICFGAGAVSLPVFVRGRKPTVDSAEMLGDRLPKVRVRGRFQNRPIMTDNPRCLGLCQQDHPMYFENGVIVKRYDRSEGCLRAP